MAEENQSTCSICLEDMDNIGKTSFLPCFHGFHQPCFNSYVANKIQMKRDVSCPVCRVVHFNYGDKNYTYIMNELGHEKVCNNFIFESSGVHARRKTEPPTGQSAPVSVSITIPFQSIEQNTRQPINGRQWDAQTMWYKYRYYIVTILIVCVLVFAIMMTIKTSSISR